MAKSLLVRIDSILPCITIKYAGKTLYYVTDVLVDKKPFALCASLDKCKSNVTTLYLPLDTIVEVKIKKPKGGVRK